MTNVAIFTIGRTAQVVTETVYALARQRAKPWLADEIHIVTTEVGAAMLPGRLTASESEPGQLARLCGKLGIKTPPVEVHVAEHEGRRIYDIRNEAEAVAFGDLIHSLIAKYANRSDGALHVSLAGGRKTMTYVAGASASLAFGAQDELSHVLVSPEAYEDHREFWHPLQDEWVAEKNAPKGAPRNLDPACAQVSLLSAPVRRLRFMKPGRDLLSLSFAQAVDEANAARIARTLTLDCRANEIRYAGKLLRPAPKEFAVMRLCAEARVRNWLGVGPEGSGPEQGGFLSYMRLAQADEAGCPLYERFVDFYADALRTARSDFHAAAEEFDDIRGWRTAVGSHDFDRWKDDKIAASLAGNLASTRAKLERNLRATFGDTLGAPIFPVLVDDGEERSRFGLTIYPDDIVIMRIDAERR